MREPLIVFLDAADPFLPAGDGSRSTWGPALRALECFSPSRVVLVETVATPDARTALEPLVAQNFPNLDVCWRFLPLDDRLPERLAELIVAEGTAGAVAVVRDAGPPAVHAAWAVTPLPQNIVIRRLEIGASAAVPPSVARETAYEVKTDTARAGCKAREPAAAYYAVDAASSRRPVDTALDDACRRIGLRGEDPNFRRALDIAARLAPHPVPLLIRGETGTGKGLLAGLIHQLSGRSGRPFVAVNCAALPETLAESLLFGHRKGAFTGAHADQPGKFALADGGTLFLDEIGELPPALQAKLLRAVEDGVVEPLGATRPVPVDVRIIAATHRDLRAAVAEGRFREDLYYRLAYAQIELPPLRARRGDIPILARHFVALVNRSLPEPRALDASAIERLQRHHWPGNIRELANTVGRSALLSPSPTITAADLLFEPEPCVVGSDSPPLPPLGPNFSLEAYLADQRARLIRAALDRAGGNQSRAARMLGISPQALNKHLRNAARSTPVESRFNGS